MAAAHVFAEHGYAAGTTNRIAEAAFLSIGSLYRYFPTKDAILLELTTRHLDDGVAAARRHLAAGLPEALDDVLRLFVRAAIDNHRDHPRLHRVLFEEAPRPAALWARLHAAEAAIVAATESLLVAHPEVRVADTRMAARIVVASIESLVHRIVVAGDPATDGAVDPEQFRGELVALLSRYLRGTPPAAAATPR